MSFRSKLWVKWGPWWLALFSSGCLVDDSRCGKNQVEYSKGDFATCECAPGFTPSADGLHCEPTKDAALPPDAEPSEEGGTAGGRLTGTDGQDALCSAPSDCTGKDAKFCITIAPNAADRKCMVQNCGPDGTYSCAADRECCDMSNLAAFLPAFGTANGLCLPKGGCAQAMGKVVTP